MEKLWKYKKIGEVCIVERGASPRPIDKYITDNESGINWIKIGDTSDSMYITETAQKIIVEGMKKSRYVKPGDFLLSNSMSFGRPYILKIDGCIHDGWLVLRDENALFDKRFLYYYLSSKTTYKKLKSMAVGGVVNNLNSEMVRNVIVPVPDKEEQSEIADLFDKIKKILDDRKQELEQLDTLVKSRFAEMFGDPIRNPKGWKVVTIGDIVTEVRYGTSKPAVEGGKYPYLRMNNLTADGHLDLNDLKYIDISDDEVEKCVVRKGDVLFNRTNSIDLVGKTAVFDLQDDMVIAGYIIRVRLNEKILPEVLSQYMNLEALKDILRSMAKGAVNQANINAQELQSIRVYVPDIELQKQFVEMKDQVDKSKSKIQKSLEETQLLFDSLMQKYFG